MVVENLLIGTVALGVTGALAAEALNVTSNALMDVNETVRARNNPNYKPRSYTREYNKITHPTQYRKQVNRHNRDVVRDMIW